MNTLFNKRMISLSLAGIIASTSLAFSANATSNLQNGENASNATKLNETTEDSSQISDQTKEVSKSELSMADFESVNKDLVKAISSMDLDKVKDAVGRGADVNYRGKATSITHRGRRTITRLVDGPRVIEYAVGTALRDESASLSIVKYLVENGAKIERSDLAHSCELGSLSLVKYFIEDLEMSISDDDNLLSRSYYHPDVVEYLLSHEVSTEALKEDGPGELDYIAKHSRNYRLMKTHRRDDTPEEKANLKRSIELLRQCVFPDYEYVVPDSGSGVESEEIADASDLQQNPETAKPSEEELSKELSIKIAERDKDGVKNVIERGVDLNRAFEGDANVKGGLPLNHACTDAWNAPIVELLVEKGADLNKEDFRGTPLRVACISGSFSIAKFLITHGADVNKKSQQFGFFDYPLHASVYGAQLVYSGLVKSLLKHGADVNVKNEEGLTPLAVAEDSKRKAEEELNSVDEKYFFDKQRLYRLKHNIPELEKSIELLRQYGAN